MRRRRIVEVIFLGGLLVVMAAILTKTLGDVLPTTLARHIGFDSESYTMVLLFVPWIQFLRPRLAGNKWEWPVTLAAAAACVAVGALLYQTDFPSQFKTLNEAFVGGGMIAYLQLRRPLPRWVPMGIAAVVLAVVIVDSSASLITNLAEGIVAMMLLPLAVDVFHRRILDPEAPQSRALLLGWYAFLVAAPVVFSVLNRSVHHGVVHTVARYGVRPQEAFVAMLLIGLYFAVLHSRWANTST